VAGTYYTFAQWQALGHDTHSVILNPDFIDNVSLIPRNPIYHSINLGSSYQTGIDVTNTWNRNAVVTKVQSSSWQNGAYVR
jgi:hypothetical protein